MFETDRVLTFWVQVPTEWGPKQIVRHALERAGCTVEEHRLIGKGEVWFKVGLSRPGKHETRPPEA